MRCRSVATSARRRSIPRRAAIAVPLRRFGRRRQDRERRGLLACGPTKFHGNPDRPVAERRRPRTVWQGAEPPQKPSIAAQKGSRVTNQPQDGRPRDAQSLKKLEMILFFSLLAGASAGILLLSLTGTTTTETAINIVAWIFVPLAVALNIWLRRQKHRAGSPSLDDVRARIDADAVRSVRANKGEASAVKELRRQEPRLRLADALELVRQL